MKYNRIYKEALYFIYNPPKGLRFSSKTVDYIVNAFVSIIPIGRYHNLIRFTCLSFKDYNVKKLLMEYKGHPMFCYIYDQTTINLTISTYEFNELTDAKVVLIDFEEIMFINDLTGK